VSEEPTGIDDFCALRQIRTIESARESETIFGEDSA